MGGPLEGPLGGGRGAAPCPAPAGGVDYDVPVTPEVGINFMRSPSFVNSPSFSGGSTPGLSPPPPPAQPSATPEFSVPKVLQRSRSDDAERLSAGVTLAAVGARARGPPRELGLHRLLRPWGPRGTPPRLGPGTPPARGPRGAGGRRGLRVGQHLRGRPPVLSREGRRGGAGEGRRREGGRRCRGRWRVRWRGGALPVPDRALQVPVGRQGAGGGAGYGPRGHPEGAALDGDSPRHRR